MNSTIWLEKNGMRIGIPRAFLIPAKPMEKKVPHWFCGFIPERRTSRNGKQLLLEMEFCDGYVEWDRAKKIFDEGSIRVNRYKGERGLEQLKRRLRGLLWLKGRLNGNE